MLEHGLYSKNLPHSSGLIICQDDFKSYQLIETLLPEQEAAKINDNLWVVNITRLGDRMGNLPRSYGCTGFDKLKSIPSATMESIYGLEKIRASVYEAHGLIYRPFVNYMSVGNETLNGATFALKVGEETVQRLCDIMDGFSLLVCNPASGVRTLVINDKENLITKSPLLSERLSLLIRDARKWNARVLLVAPSFVSNKYSVSLLHHMSTCILHGAIPSEVAKHFSKEAEALINTYSQMKDIGFMDGESVVLQYQARSKIEVITRL